MKKTSIITLLLIYAIAVTAQPTITVGNAHFNARQWITSHFAKGKVPPFSFKYGGKPSASFITKWRHSLLHTASHESGTVNYTATYADPATGLEIQVLITGYTRFPAVEWVMRITNRSKANSLQISDFNVVNATLASNLGKKGFTLNYNHGSRVEQQDFTPRQKAFAATGDTITLQPAGGRSSDGVLPFYNIALGHKQGIYYGVMNAVGWSGCWRTSMATSYGNKLTLTSGQRHFNAYLKPSESVRTPRYAFMFWHGNNEFSGNNQWRRFMTEHHTAKIDGKPTIYPISASFEGGNSPQPCVAFTCLTEDWAKGMMRRHREFGLYFDNYWLDAGWYQDAQENGWEGRLNWNPDTTRFPHGLLPVAQEAHKGGATFMVWFEPERTSPGSPWRINHPSWVLHYDGKRSASAQQDTDARYAFMDLSNPAVVDFITDSITTVMQNNGIDNYRQDFNYAPLEAWLANDEPSREGIVEAKYIEGLYRFWDNLRKRFPHAFIDNCASGGRRIDLETMSRSAPLWRTDYDAADPDGPDGAQCHTYGLNLYLPQSGTSNGKLDYYAYRSCLTTAPWISWRINNPANNYKVMQQRLDDVKHMRTYMMADYYPLSGIDKPITGRKVKLAYQFHKPSTSDGYVFVFRRSECPDSTITLRLYGLNAQGTYTITNKDTGVSRKATGAQLMSPHTIELGKPRSSQLFYYKEK